MSMVGTWAALWLDAMVELACSVAGNRRSSWELLERNMLRAYCPELGSLLLFQSLAAAASDLEGGTVPNDWSL